MGKITLIPYQADHAIDLHLREEEGAVRQCKDFENWAVINETPFSWSAQFENEILACGGVRKLWEGVGEAWLLWGNQAITHRFSVVKAVRGGLEIALTSFHRVQAHARMDFSVAHMFLRSLGFKEEGFMREYCPDRVDAILYSIVREDLGKK